MEFVLPPAWRALLQEETEKPYWKALAERVDAAYEAGTVYPPRAMLFSAFERTPPDKVRVVILGQDPYHEPGQANGLAFSVRPGIKLPPSLQNIYKELEADLSVPAAKNGDLTSWARQGVFLLNTVLSVQAHRANAHKDFGWQTFTDAVIAALVSLPQPIAFLLWGAQAQKKGGNHPQKSVFLPCSRESTPSPLLARTADFSAAGRFPGKRVSAFVRFSCD